MKGGQDEKRTKEDVDQRDMTRDIELWAEKEAQGRSLFRYLVQDKE